MLITDLIPQTPIDTVNVADSAKVAVLELSEKISSDPQGFFAGLLQDFIHFGIKVVIALVIYIVGAWLIRRIKKGLQKLFVKRNTDKTIATFVSSLVSITLTALLIIITISELGVNTTSLAAILAAGGVAVGMALSGTVQNFAGGLMLLVFKPFKAGDYIKALGYEGIVTEVNIVNTKICTVENNTIILPNGALSGGNIDNFSHLPYHRCTWCIDVDYSSNPDIVRSALLGIIKGDEKILDTTTEGVPSNPVVFLTKLKESTVEFQLRAWVKTEDYWPVLLKYNEEIFKTLPQMGIAFAFPQMDVHIKK